MTAVRDRCRQAPLAGRHSHTGTYHGRHKAHGHRVLSSATPSVLGDFTHHFIRNEGAVAKFSFGRLGSRPPPPVGQGAATATAPAGPERHCREMRWAARVGPSLLASRGDPDRGLTAWVPPCSRPMQRKAWAAPRFPRPPPAEGPRRFRQCRSGPTRATAIPRLGSYEARSEGPRVHLIGLLVSDSTMRGGIFNAGDENPHHHPGANPLFQMS